MPTQTILGLDDEGVGARAWVDVEIDHLNSNSLYILKPTVTFPLFGVCFYNCVQSSLESIHYSKLLAEILIVGTPYSRKLICMYWVKF